jgi:hypothetical protein
VACKRFEFVGVVPKVSGGIDEIIGCPHRSEPHHLIKRVEGVGYQLVGVRARRGRQHRELC